EIWRVNMPSGNINYGTFAASTSSDDAMASINLPNSLVSGNNVLSVEVHQRSNSSSDISFDFKLVGNPPGVVNVARGPYLQQGSPTSVTVKWRTSTSTESVVNYGTSLGNLNQTVSNNNPKTEHELVINGLLPNALYFYEVANASNVLIPGAADQYFKTAPAAGTQQAITAWILGDCGTGNGNARAVRDAYYNYIGTGHTDMILFLGDNAYNDGTDTEYQFALFENMYEDKLKNSISWSCLGNHDGHSANSSTQSGPYYEIFSFPTQAESGGTASFTEAYYSFDYGNVHFLSLDSYESDRSVGGSMYTWCQSDIQNTTADWIVAFWHHPAYTKGSHDSDSEGALIEMRQNFLPMLEANGVDLVLSGHSHSYERSYFLNGHYGGSNSFDPAQHTVGVTGGGNGRSDGDGAYTKSTSQTDGAVYITSGSAGKTSNGSLDHEAMFYSVAQLGSCVLEVNGNELTVKFVRETGSVEDYFTIQKDLSCSPNDPCDDGDPCTINDIYDSNCDCAGTMLDSDGDGVCDASDQCPDQDDALIGTACNDNDDCTISDTYDGSCNCVGVFEDSDEDGVCDADDICPGFDDAVDSDGDGTPDGCEVCNPQSNQFSPDPLTHTGTGSSTSVLNFTTMQENVVFQISDLDARTKKRKSNRFIDLATVTYIDGTGTTQILGTYSGLQQSTADISIFDQVQSIMIALNDGYDGNAGVIMSLDISDVSSCDLGSTRLIERHLVAGNSSGLSTKLELYPNPTSTVLTVDFISDDSTAKTPAILEIVDIHGLSQMRREMELTDGAFTKGLDVQELVPG
ncbi:MAG: metallophosphoesterase, partial [Saprospiraceae bacterium]|nr:metallophosphoesterase [Saprospiraceae bacterium]